jgi:hypothetical protein
MQALYRNFCLVAVCFGLVCDMAHGFQQIKSRNDAIAFLQLKYFEKNTLQEPGAIEQAIVGDDAYFACRARWQQISSNIENREKGSRLVDVLSQNMDEFRGYVHAKIGARPPDEWIKYLSGEKVGGWSGNDAVSMPLDGNEYQLRLFTFFEDGSINNRSASGEILWTVPLFALNPATDFIGHLDQRYWLKIERVKETGTLYVWCAGVDRMAYVIAVDDDSGKRINLLYLNQLDQH